MSVTAHSPYAGAKRFIGEEENLPDRLGGLVAFKRSRGSPRSSGQRCSSEGQLDGHRVTPSILAALRGLFPEMDDRKISSVLEECGDNIEATIARLNELRILEERTAAHADPATSAQEALESGGAGRSTPTGPSPPHQATQAATRASATSASLSPASPRSPRAAADAAREDTTVRAVAERLVGELHGAKSVLEARDRAERVVRAFTREVLPEMAQALAAAQRRQEEERRRAGAGGAAAVAGSSHPAASAGPTAPAPAPPVRDAAELARENALLRRAVAIQAQRSSEAVAARDEKLAEAERACQQLQSRVRELEMSNYSLQIHLARSQAERTGGVELRNPDVY